MKDIFITYFVPIITGVVSSLIATFFYYYIVKTSRPRIGIGNKMMHLSQEGRLWFKVWYQSSIKYTEIEDIEIIYCKKRLDNYQIQEIQPEFSLTRTRLLFEDIENTKTLRLGCIIDPNDKFFSFENDDRIVISVWSINTRTGIKGFKQQVYSPAKGNIIVDPDSSLIWYQNS